MKIVVLKKAQAPKPSDRFCPFVVEGLPEPSK